MVPSRVSSLKDLQGQTYVHQKKNQLQVQHTSIIKRKKISDLTPTSWHPEFAVTIISKNLYFSELLQFAVRIVTKNLEVSFRFPAEQIVT